MSPTTLEAQNLAKTYGGVSLFSGLTFSVETGLTAIQGRNGSGKTTLIKILSSLLRPSAGGVRLRLGDRELAGDEKRLAIGWAGLDLAFYERSEERRVGKECRCRWSAYPVERT